MTIPRQVGSVLNRIEETSNTPEELVQIDPGYMRPYIENGQAYVSLKTDQKVERKDANGKVITNSIGEPIMRHKRCEVKINSLRNSYFDTPIWNATTLRRDQWLHFENRMITISRQEQQVWKDFLALDTYTDFDGMGTMVLDHEIISDSHEAVVDMDTLSDGRNDTPLITRQGLPLPFTYAKFFFSQREIAVARNRGNQLPDVRIDNATEKVTRKTEQMAIGTSSSVTFGDASLYVNAPTIYGLTNHPNRVIKADMVAPDGTNGAAVKNSWLAFREGMYAVNQRGPYIAYVSSNYDQYLDADYSTADPGSSGTLRENLLKTPNIQTIKSVDYLDTTNHPDTVILVQQTARTARAVVGMPLSVVQWESEGKAKFNFRVATISVPQIFADYDGRCGVGHGTAA